MYGFTHDWSYSPFKILICSLSPFHLFSTTKYAMSQCSRLHSQTAIQSNGLSIHHGILHQELHQVGKLVTMSQASWKWYCCGQEVEHLFWQIGQQWGVKETWKKQLWYKEDRLNFQNVFVTFTFWFWGIFDTVLFFKIKFAIKGIFPS